jgi:hypothetical protein
MSGAFDKEVQMWSLLASGRKFAHLSDTQSLPGTILFYNNCLSSDRPSFMSLIFRSHFLES